MPPPEVSVYVRVQSPPLPLFRVDALPNQFLIPRVGIKITVESVDFFLGKVAFSSHINNTPTTLIHIPKGIYV